MSYQDSFENTLSDELPLLCGSTASFDYGSGISYRCNTCNAVLGSVGMPSRCRELYDMESVVEKLKGKND